MSDGSGFNDQQAGVVPQQHSTHGRTAFTASGRNNPCPVCQRVKDGDCRISTELVLCHNNVDHRTGETVIGADGQKWAFLGVASDGRCGQFRVDRPNPSKPVRPGNRREWIYTSQAGEPLIRVCRTDDGQGNKKIWQERLKGTGRAVSDLLPAVMPYRYQDALQALEKGAPFVIWAEGEPCVDALWAVGIPAVTSIGGTPGFRPKRDKGLLPADRLVIAPDRDQKGIDYARRVAAAYPGARWLLCFPDQPSMWNGCCPPDGGLDVVDWIAAGATREAIISAISGQGPAVDDPSDTPPALPPTVTPQIKSFDQLWQDLEALADQLAASHHSYTRQVAQLRHQSREWGLSLGEKGLEQALDAAQRRRRPQSAPIPRGGTFRVKSKPWAVQGLFRAGVNLLVGQSGAGKSRLAAYTGAQWIYGSPSVLGFDIHGPAVDKRQLLILGTDQDRDDWHQTLAPYGLAETVEAGEDWSVVKLHDRVEVLTLENGMRLGPDGLAFIRKRADEFGNGLMLIADSLAKLLPDGIDEDKSPAAGPIYNLVDALGDGWGILLHHTRKAAGKEQNLGVNAGRGSGAIDAAVSRVVGLGLIHHMEHGQMVAEESNPNRELLSTKRGGATLHVVVRMAETGWELIGDAGEQKRQQRIAQARQNLTTDQLRVLDACDAQQGSWLTIKQIAHALGLSTSDSRWSQSSDAAAIRQRTARLAELDLLDSQVVGKEKQYRSAPEAAPGDDPEAL
jgi:hypothetical protein